MNDYGSAESNPASDTSSNGELKVDGAYSFQTNGEGNNTKEGHEDLEKKCGPDAYPLHYLVWHNNYRKLENELTENKVSSADIIKLQYLFLYVCVFT